MKQIHCLHDLIDHLARNGAVIVLSPFNSAEIEPSVDLGKLQIVPWPVTQFSFGSPDPIRWIKEDSNPSPVSDGPDSNIQQGRTQQEAVSRELEDVLAG